MSSIAEIKQKMLVYEDFYGFDISDKEAIKNAKTKKELAEILENVRRLHEGMLSDAGSHLDNFKKQLGLYCL